MLKVGIFGVGHLGKYHLANWQQMTDVEVAGFYDPSDNMAQEVSEKFQNNIWFVSSVKESKDDCTF